MVAEGIELQHAMPARIVTAEHLRTAQLSMARRGVPLQACQELPLPASSGRVLARGLDIADIDCSQQTLPAGTRLDWYPVPLLAASGHASVRCGTMTMQAAGQGGADVSSVAWRAERLSDERGRLLRYLPLVEWLH